MFSRGLAPDTPSLTHAMHPGPNRKTSQLAGDHGLPETGAALGRAGHGRHGPVVSGRGGTVLGGAPDARSVPGDQGKGGERALVGFWCHGWMRFCVRGRVATPSLLCASSHIIGLTETRHP